jgi:beta-1,3-galactosyltransferase 1
MFVMGKTTSIKMMQDALAFEANTYGDILEEDFEDTYHNLTYKGIAALKFISHYCNNVKYVLKTDDDVFVNMYTLQNHLIQLDAAGFNKNLIICLVWWKMHALREGKWAIPVEVYPDSLYPPYCSGMAYVYSTDVAQKLYDASFFVKFFWVDDVYVSGMLPKHANVNHTSMIKVYCGKQEMEDLFSHPTEWYKYIFTHVHDEDLFLKTWDRVSALAKKTNIPTPSKISPGLLADTYEPKDKVVKKKEDPKKEEAKKEERKDEKKKVDVKKNEEKEEVKKDKASDGAAKQTDKNNKKEGEAKVDENKIEAPKKEKQKEGVKKP